MHGLEEDRSAFGIDLLACEGDIIDTLAVALHVILPDM